MTKGNNNKEGLEKRSSAAAEQTMQQINQMIDQTLERAEELMKNLETDRKVAEPVQHHNDFEVALVFGSDFNSKESRKLWY